MALNDDQNLECPLCMEPFEMDDFTFFPCTCGYQICRFCWHRIRTDENDLCPACRKQYPEDPADFKPLSVEELQKIKSEKRQKDQQRKQKMSDCRKHLANVRVVQKNLVFVVGLPTRLADADVLKKHDYFGKFGKIHKVVVNQSTSYAGSQGPSASAYVTYCRPEDALRAIKSVNNIQVDGRTLKASLGTTKYCSHFLKNQQCPKTDCMYLHELGDEAASFTKEDMQQGKHQEYEKKLQDQIFGCNNRKQSSPIPQQNSADSEDTWPCTVHNLKEQRPNRSKDSTQGQKSDKPSRSKGKHNAADTQKSKKNKIRTTDSSHNSANMNKSSNKDESPVTKKAQKHSRHNKNQSTTNDLPLQRVEELLDSPHKNTEISEKNVKSAHTESVEIIEKLPPTHSSATIQITRSASPSLPPSPASSSSSLFTPFGSLSSNFLSSSPSPPPSNVSQPFQIVGNTTVQEPTTTNTFAMPSSIEHDRSSPCNLFINRENTDSLFSHLGTLPISSDLSYCSNDLSNEDEVVSNEESEWNSRYHLNLSPKQLEDDLDFDPWDESSKGLADLMAKEANINPTYSSTISMPPGFSNIKPSVPNGQRVAVPPPGFGIRQMPIPEALIHLHSNYSNNQDFNSKMFIADKRQALMEAQHQLLHQPNPDIHSTNQSCQYVNHPACDVNSQMIKEYLRTRRQTTIQDNFRALFPNINVSFSSQGLPKAHHNQNGTSWNAQFRDLSWLYGGDNLLNGGNISDSQRTAPYFMKALQQLKIEDTLNPYNGHNSYSAPFALRGQWPPSSLCPPPGFVAPSSSAASNPFQHVPVNQKI